MLFKNFDVDADFVLIDNQKIARPSYINPSAWYDFWSFTPEANDSENIQSIIDKEVEAICRSKEMEHEDKLEQQARELVNDFDDKIEVLLQEIRNKFYQIEDLIEKSRPSKNE